MMLNEKSKEQDEEIIKHEKMIAEYEKTKAILDKKCKEQGEALKKHEKMISDYKNEKEIQDKKYKKQTEEIENLKNDLKQAWEDKDEAVKNAVNKQVSQTFSSRFLYQMAIT